MHEVRPLALALRNQMSRKCSWGKSFELGPGDIEIHDDLLQIDTGRGTHFTIVYSKNIGAHRQRIIEIINGIWPLIMRLSGSFKPSGSVFSNFIVKSQFKFKFQLIVEFNVNVNDGNSSLVRDAIIKFC